MNMSIAIPIVAAILGLACMAYLVYSLVRAPKADFRNLMVNRGTGRSQAAMMRQRLEEDETGIEFERIKSEVRKNTKQSSEPTLEEKMFRAGIFSEQQKKDFKRLQVLGPTIGGVIGIALGRTLGGLDVILMVGVLGTVIGLYLPFRVLARRKAARDEDILFYLPLVIEQISIGVSSSLDIGPCLARVVQMADERDSHNPVTELLRYAQFHMKSGVGMEEALGDIGKLSGNIDLKHSFMALAQVAKFGGEISHQLQELADSVSATREVRIEEKIKKLELEATAPVALVFFGYIIILLVGFGLQITRNL